MNVRRLLRTVAGRVRTATVRRVSRRPIFLHIGCGKSGTTSLQRALYASVPQLLDQGVGMPLSSRAEALRLLFRPLVGLTPGEPVPPRTQRRMSALTELLQDAKGDRLLISLEDLCELPEAGIAMLVDTLSEYDVHVIITARDWSKQIPSDWQELVKQRLPLSYSDFVWAVRNESPNASMFRLRQHVPDIARRWATRVPPENIHIVAVAPPVPDPRRLFHLIGGVVGFDATTLEAPPRLRNVSLGYEQAETLRRITLALGDRLPNGRKDFRPAARAIFDGPLRAETGTKLRLPREHQEWCRQQGLAMLEELRRGGYDIVGNPDDLVSVVDESAPDLPEITDAVVAETAVKALAAVVQSNHNKLLKERGNASAVAEQDENAHA
jgi:hypothetical protein